jgi:Mg2+ and Co2+ transporter CorA
MPAEHVPSSTVWLLVAAIAQRQGDQINRLTLVSLIFLPLTFITGFFGMNFGWMNEVIGSRPAFVALGVALPAVSVIVTVAWLRRRGLI